MVAIHVVVARIAGAVTIQVGLIWVCRGRAVVVAEVYGVPVVVAPVSGVCDPFIRVAARRGCQRSEHHEVADSPRHQGMVAAVIPGATGTC